MARVRQNLRKFSWKNDRYWEQKLNLLRSLARPDGHSHGSRRDQGQERSHVNYVRTEGICRKWNDQHCDETPPHSVNGVKLFHLCLYCFKKDPVVLDDHPANLCPKKPPGHVKGGGGGNRPPYRGGKAPARRF